MLYANVHSQCWHLLELTLTVTFSFIMHSFKADNLFADLFELKNIRKVLGKPL